MTALSTNDIPRSVARLLDLFESVVEAGSLSLTAAADHNGLTPTTARRYLLALEARGYLQRDDAGDYRTGPTTVRLAAHVGSRSETERLIATAGPVLADVCSAAGETAYLVVRDGDHATYAAGAECDRAVRHTGGVGQLIDLSGTAAGAALAEPGRVVARNGAVEPDITAVCLATSDSVAISVVGPSHRLAPERLGEIEQILRRHTRRLTPNAHAIDQPTETTP